MTDTITEVSTLATDEIKKPPKELPVVQDQGFFQHVTGDSYDGYFEAKKKGRSVKMHGPGVYTTAEGDSYSGTWEADRLGANEEITITFTDTSKYEGLLRDWCYADKGKYLYPDGSLLKCDFVKNCPVGPMTLTDPNGHMWLGLAEPGFGWFEPVNHFYEMLEKNKEPGKIKRRTKSSAISGSQVPLEKMK